MDSKKTIGYEIWQRAVFVVLSMILVLFICLHFGGQSLHYYGDFIDLAQEEAAARSVQDGGMRIRKIDAEMGYGVVTSLKTGHITMSYPKIIIEGKTYQLRFKNHQLTGYYLCSEKDLKQTFTGEYVYETDPVKLQAMLDEYVRQVRLLKYGESI